MKSNVNDDEQASSPAFIVLSPGDIAARAYELYVVRGATDGSDREDWLRAEQQLKARGQTAHRDAS